MPVSAEGRVENQKRTQTANTLWPFRLVFGVQLGSLENKMRREPVHAALVHILILLRKVTYHLLRKDYFIKHLRFRGEEGAVYFEN